MVGLSEIMIYSIHYVYLVLNYSRTCSVGSSEVGTNVGQVQRKLGIHG